MSLISRFQLQDKLLLLGVMPAAIVAIILATYLTSTRLNDMYDLLHKTNENLCLSIAKSSVNGVFSGNLAALDAVVRSVVNEPDILSIKITDSAERLFPMQAVILQHPHYYPTHQKKLFNQSHLNQLKTRMNLIAY